MAWEHVGKYGRSAVSKEMVELMSWGIRENKYRTTAGILQRESLIKSSSFESTLTTSNIEKVASCFIIVGKVYKSYLAIHLYDIIGSLVRVVVDIHGWIENKSRTLAFLNPFHIVRKLEVVQS